MDWAAEGLLDGLQGDAREARVGLLDELHDDGASLDDLRRAVGEDRLALLPIERAMLGEPRHSAREIAEVTGLDVAWLLRYRRVIGLSAVGPDEPVFTDADIEESRRGKVFREAGLPDEEALAVERILGQGMARYADAFRLVFAQAFLQPGDSEADVARRYVAAGEFLKPLTGEHFAHVFFLHLRELIRQDVLDAEMRSAGRLSRREQTTVAFADLVGFTELSERVDVDDIGGLAGRLGTLAQEVAEPPVRLVKELGDGVMFVAPEPGPALEAMLRMVAGSEQAALPELRAGVARGPAINRYGDWYGSTVNLASRLSDRARPGSVLTTSELRDALGDHAERFAFSEAGLKRLKGFEQPVATLRVRRAGEVSAPDG